MQVREELDFGGIFMEDRDSWSVLGVVKEILFLVMVRYTSSAKDNFVRKA